MGFTDWLGLATKKSKACDSPEDCAQAVPVVQSTSKSFPAAVETSRDENCLAKILMVQEGDYSSQITEYAIRMAKRLDCAIVAVDISNKPLHFSGERKIRESDRFIEKARKNGEQFVAFAESSGIQATHVMDIGDTDEIIARMRENDQNIQYVINRFTPETVKHTQTVEQKIPVLALRYLQPQKQTHQ